MRRRFLADEIEGRTAILTGQNAAHLARVLRARIGQEYEIAAEGKVRIGRVTNVANDRVEFELGDEVAATAIPPVKLILSIFKFDRFEWVIEKATELGVASIVPVIARRTDAHLAQAASKRVERWRRIVHEASQQSRRAAPPEIAEPVKLKDAIATPLGLKVLLAETEEDQTLRSVLERATFDSITLAVGPEGGWTDDELRAFSKGGWIAATLGPTILRAETAAIAGLAVVNSLLP